VNDPDAADRGEGDDRERAPSSGWTAEVRQALNRLEPLQRTVLQLSYHMGRTQAEIAQQLDLPPRTVRTLTARAMQQLALSLLSGAHPGQ